MKKFMLTLSVIIWALMASVISPSFVSANTNVEAFNSAYNYLVTTPFETVDDGEIIEYATKVESAIVLAETIAQDQELASSVNDFSYKHNFVLKKYKFFVSDYKLEVIYNPQDFSNTENGIIKINSEKSIAKTAIEYAANKEQVDNAYLTFYNLINSNDLAKNVSTVKTQEDSIVSATATTLNNSLYFSTDDYLVVTKYNNSAIVKNAKVALMDSEELLMENGGIAYYFNVQLSKGGVMASEITEELIVTISLEEVGLTVEDGAPVQIVKYKGNRQVEFISALVANNNVMFNVSEVGAYALCLEGYALENRSAVVTFFKNYGVYLLLALLLVFLIVAPIQYNRKLKKKKLKAEKKEYKRYKKAKKLEIKNQKKKKRKKE